MRFVSSPFWNTLQDWSWCNWRVIKRWIERRTDGYNRVVRCWSFHDGWRSIVISLITAWEDAELGIIGLGIRRTYFREARVTIVDRLRLLSVFQISDTFGCWWLHSPIVPSWNGMAACGLMTVLFNMGSDCLLLIDDRRHWYFALSGYW